MQKKIVILYSGGLDSFIMKKLAETKYPNADVKLVHFDIGQEYSEKELVAIKDSGYDVEIRKVDWLSSGQKLNSKVENNGGNIFIPGRNMILSGLAASIFLPDEVWLGGLKGEDHKTATDKNKTFVDKTNDIWSYVYSPFEKIPKLVFPLVDENWGKFEAVEWLYKNGKATKEEIIKTSSCLSHSESKNCGHCMVCLRRKYIFLQLGFEEEYEQNPLTNINNLKMIIEMLKSSDEDEENTHYDKWRKREIIPGLQIEFNTEKKEDLLKIIETKLTEIENRN